MPYGNDPVTARFEARLREVFEAPEARAFLTATGTAANSLALATLCTPWATVSTHALSHIENDECGAPEFYTGGAKLTLLSGEGAKIDPEDFRARLRAATPHDLHNVARRPLDHPGDRAGGGLQPRRDPRPDGDRPCRRPAGAHGRHPLRQRAGASGLHARRGELEGGDRRPLPRRRRRRR